MESSDTKYRLKLALGFLSEAKEQFKHKLFRAVVDDAQLSVENSIKAVIALFKPVPKIHEIDETIEDLLEEVEFSENERQKLKRLQELAEILGFETHLRTDYGDELQQVTPWELYDEDEAQKALSFAEESFNIADELLRNRLNGAGKGKSPCL
ncbi:MAG: HEPN domain-containing protein [Candidatus Edwardsbacteria bacterium]